MTFNIITNEALERANGYFTTLLYHGLSDLGRRVSVTPGWHMAGSTDVVYLFHLLDDPELLPGLEARPEGFVIFCQEIVLGDGINGWALEPHRKARLARSLAAARLVLTPYRDSLPALERACRRVAYCPFGHHARVEAVRHGEDRHFDVCFYGTSGGSSRRQDLLRRIARRRLAVGICGLEAPPATRNGLIGVSRITLNIGHPPPLGHASPRVPFLANNRACCASNAAPDPDGYLAYATVHGDDDGLVEGCVELVRSGRWRDAADDGYARFRATSFTRNLEAALDGA